ncbi:EamA-like transporter family protein [Humitalea rosea]|uniref:EamA-like transporter family protein n=1 Tax=Humitalea rosea TaxID=990373 RepID=A0A2W7ITJ2_9PROT|nr:EamA family transporter [Humitalea rosea]PZW49193.1 EamA-like transporter family protein [Humitalea rosea]
MRRGIVFGFLLLLGFDIAAQLGFKYAALAAEPLAADAAWLLRVAAHPPIYVAMLGYVGAFFTWMALLRHAPIGPAFAASHLEVVAIMPIAMLLFGEEFSWVRLCGALAILGGILCLAADEAHGPA